MRVCAPQLKCLALLGGILTLRLNLSIIEFWPKRGWEGGVRLIMEFSIIFFIFLNEGFPNDHYHLNI